MMHRFALLPLTFLFLVALGLGGCTSTRNDPGSMSAPNGDLPPTQSAQLCIATAAQMEANGYYDQAIMQYERARRFDPTKAFFIAHRLAILYDKTGRTSKALEEYNLAVDNDRNSPTMANDMGFFYYRRGQWESAQPWFRRSVSLDPKFNRGWVNLGLTLAQQEKYDEALVAFQQAISLAGAHSNIGIIQAQHGQFDKARRSLTYALNLEPNLDRARAILGWINSREGLTTLPVEIDPDAAGAATQPATPPAGPVELPAYLPPPARN